jgi:hypothetical protein
MLLPCESLEPPISQMGQSRRRQPWPPDPQRPAPAAECGHSLARRPRRPKRRASATGQTFGGCFDEHVVQRGYALTLPHTSR